MIIILQGRNHGWKVDGTKVWVSKPGRLHSAPCQRPGWRWVREGVAPPAVGVRWYHLRKMFENSDAKSCILVTTTLISGLPRTCISECGVIDVERLIESHWSSNTCCEISCFLKTTAKKLGDQYIVGPPDVKVEGDQSPPVPTVVAPMLYCVPNLLCLATSIPKTVLARNFKKSHVMLMTNYPQRHVAAQRGPSSTAELLITENTEESSTSGTDISPIGHSSSRFAIYSNRCRASQKCLLSGGIQG